MTPATEKAIARLAQLSERQFVGTESRLLTLFDPLKQMSEGSDAEIARVLSGDAPLLDDTAVKDRFSSSCRVRVTCCAPTWQC